MPEAGHDEKRRAKEAELEGEELLYFFPNVALDEMEDAPAEGTAS